ncbi:aminotransferase class I/II-fold pyridoxal phosphate-dependent enzyme [Pedobacter sp. L105]|uniref:aminotransferase class I/II-fold pyridoxal phosphate-dependent enzyme n=1 Tax=Pedobacter sp. L105 TaxID=1641871 RepID=UPI00352AA6E7
MVIDGVYSQDGNLARMYEIYNLTKQYGAFLMVDDAHGIGVLGSNAIVYPGVSRKDARIRTSLMATHTRGHLDRA